MTVEVLSYPLKTCTEGRHSLDASPPYIEHGQLIEIYKCTDCEYFVRRRTPIAEDPR